MFGDKLLFGQTKNRVDSNKRIFLPAKSGREKGDVVFLLYDRDINEYKVFPYFVIESKFKKYDDLISSAKSSSELKEYKLILNEFANSIIRSCIVDSQGRIILSDDFVANEEITVIGSGNHLILKKKNDK